MWAILASGVTLVIAAGLVRQAEGKLHFILDMYVPTLMMVDDASKLRVI
jgi:hypothetical protein